MKNRWVAAVVLGVAVIGFFVIRARQGAGAGKTSYRVATVARGSIRKTVSATGTLQPWTTVDIKSKAGGKINLLAVDVGDRVKPNQVIAKIDPTDSLLTYNESKADTDAARAKQSQSDATYQLQVKQTVVSIDQAQAALRAAQANLTAAGARLQTARDQSGVQPQQTAATIAQAKANYDSVVQQRAQLVATQEQDRASSKAAYDQAVANDRNTQLAWERQKTLFAKGFVAKQVVDQAEAAAAVTAAQVASTKIQLDTITVEQKAVADATDAKVRQALAQWNAAKSQADIQTKRDAVAEAESAYQQANAQVGQALASLHQAQANVTNDEIKAYDIKSAQASTAHASAALSNAKTTLDQTTVRAPSDGVVLQKYVEQGTIITSGLSLNSTGTSIVQIGDVSKMYVNVLVDETDIASVRVGERVNVTMDAYPGTPFKGSVSLVSPQAQVAQNVTSVAVRVELDNTQKGFNLLKPAMNATCEFVVDEKRNVLSAPSDAVQTDAQGSYVQVVVSPPSSATTSAKGKGKAGGRSAQTATLQDVKLEHRTVQVGFQGDDAVEITSGLKEGEVIVVQTITATTAAPATAARGAVGGFGGRGGGGGGPPPGGR
ncbi:MAG: efflux RND transporter periplasmic adaptor subunit [Fimbriimonadales bacterium]